MHSFFAPFSNLCVAAIASSLGMLFLWYTWWKETNQLGPNRIKWAYACWLAQWFVLVGVYAYLTVFLAEPRTPHPLVNVVVDLESLLSIWFFFHYVFGDALQRRILIGVAADWVVFVVLVSTWGLSMVIVFASYLPEWKDELLVKLFRLGLSELLGTISGLLVGLAFFLRYIGPSYKMLRWLSGATALLFLAYALCQLPIYILVFNPGHEQDAGEMGTKHLLMYILAGGKFLKMLFAFCYFWRPFWWREGPDLEPLGRNSAFILPWGATIVPQQIFISYHGADDPLAKRIAAGLEAKGYTAWRFVDHQEAGMSHLDLSSQQIEGAEALVLLISASALDRHQITVELGLARKLGKFLLPVLVDIPESRYEESQKTWRDLLGSPTISLSLQDHTVEYVVDGLIASLQSRGIQPARSL